MTREKCGYVDVSSWRMKQSTDCGNLGKLLSPGEVLTAFAAINASMPSEQEECSWKDGICVTSGSVATPV